MSDNKALGPGLYYVGDLDEICTSDQSSEMIGKAIDSTVFRYCGIYCAVFLYLDEGVYCSEEHTFINESETVGCIPFDLVKKLQLDFIVPPSIQENLIDFPGYFYVLEDSDELLLGDITYKLMESN